MEIIGDHVDQVFEAFRGPSALARALGEPVSTVLSWKAKRRIPRWRREPIRVAAETAGVAERLPFLAEAA